MNRYRGIALIIGLLALIAAIAVPVANAALNGRGRTDTVEFDVSEDMTRFIFNKDITFEDGLPADGSNFITRGYLYPNGTLTCTDDGCDGVNADGSPQYPDQVLGEWICEGYMINDAGHATGGKWVFSTQFFEWTDAAGTHAVVTQGYELADVDVPFSRAITGGTGAYKDARGESEQTLLGLNVGQGVSLRVKLNVRTR